jgi:response regulator RpfG family c-di-GMP phosphodiesterase
MLEDKPEELELLTLVAVKDYINMLKKTGELTAADIKLMQDHPSITAELDGFREYLAKVIRRARKVESDD